MCGVTGVFAYHYAAPPADAAELRAIRDHMAARGPDGPGEWLDPAGRVALGHRRLAIIDPTPAGNQPMASADGGTVISFSGEIYNHAELRTRLEGEGVRFRTRSDTEVLLELYRRRGTAMFAELRGMYAFVLWDAGKGAVLLARDAYGIKPLYYADDGWTVRAASQVKALLAGGRVDRAADPAGIVGFYLWGSVPEPFTLYRAIRAVPAGTYVWVDALGAHAPQRHHSIAAVLAEAAETAPADPAETVRAALLESVRYHLVADVPVGLFLSAGIDSGTLLALMREAGYPRIRTLTLAFEEFAGTPQDEAPLAERVARSFGSEHVTRRVSLAEFQADLPRILQAMDQPSIDGVNTWFVAKAAHEQGLRVALSGLGGDELFGGYPSFREIPRWVRTLALPARIPGAGQAFRALAGALLRRSSPKLPGLLQYGGTYAGAYLLKRGLFMPWELPALLPPELVEAGLERLDPLARLREELQPDPGTPRARVAALEATGYMRNQLLRDADWAAMAHSVEVRVPLVDVQLLRAVAPLLRRGLIDGKRWLAASARPALPADVVGRSKTGFGVPLGDWRRTVAAPAEAEPWARTWARHVMRAGAFAGAGVPCA
jgi:asparagine synthase (glutamine-hydrolysing)